MRKLTTLGLRLSVVTFFLCGLFLASATKASAHFITNANATVTCTDYNITFNLEQLHEILYRIDYQLVPSCSIPVSPVTGSVSFTPTGSTATEFASGPLSLPDDCTVTGSATLNSEDGMTGPVPILFDGQSFTTVNCPVCTISGVTISNTSWNKFPLPSGTCGTSPVVWVHAHIGKPSGIPTNQVSTVLFTGASITISGTKYNLPDGLFTFNPAAPKTITTKFNAALNRWETLINPSSMSDEMFFTGAAIPVTPDIAAGGKATVSFTVESSAPNLSFPWQWSAAVYTCWPADWNQALIQPFHSSYHAGTPLNTAVQKSLVQGPRGGGGSNFTGSWSATGKGVCP